MKKLINQTDNFVCRDPLVIKHNGLFYRCYTEDTNSISIACAETIGGLTSAVGEKVYIPEDNKEYSKELWAPELHIIDNKCYIYVACDNGANYFHRMYVLANDSDNPLDTYEMKGKLVDSTDKWAIDGTVMKYGGKLYFVWSGWEGDVNVAQNLYIAEMENPYTIKSDRFLISEPEYDWEKIGAAEDRPFINEGPYTFDYAGKMYLTYSASGSWCEDYCITALVLDGENPLDRNAWKKLDKPILSSNALVKGAGHCSILEDDGVINVFFHAWDKEEKNIDWNTVSLWHGVMNIDGDKISIE